MRVYRVTFRRDDGSERAVRVRAADRAEAIGRASARADRDGPPRPGRIRILVERG
jgi:hypothetical protein